MFKLAITAGHIMSTPGKRCLKKIDPNETREWWLNDRIADKIEKMLAEYDGIKIIRTDDTYGKEKIDLATRVKSANNFGADFYLSIHHNAGIKGGSGGGIVAFVKKSANSETLAWQKELYNELIKRTGLKGNRSNPLPKKNYHETKYPKMPAVLLELGFMDSKKDTPIILTDKYATQCAEACVAIIVKKAKLVKKTSVAPTPAPSKPTSVKNLKRDMKCDEVRRLQNLLNLLGYDCGEADGSYGSKTEKAVIAFQKKNKISADGVFGTTSYNTLLKVLSKSGITIKYNNKKYNKKAEALQNILNDYGYLVTKPNGYFGPNTESAVKKFQKDRKITTTGIASTKTIAAMKDYLKL